MGLQSVFKTAAQTAQTAFGDVFVTVRYEAIASSVYDASSGVVSAVASSYTVQMAFEGYDRRDIDNQTVNPTDVKGMIAQNNLTPVPTHNDKIHRVEATVSVVYEVINIMQDPAGALWEFQLRK